MKTASCMAVLVASALCAQAVTFYTNPTVLGSTAAEADFIAKQNQGMRLTYLDRSVNPGSNPATYDNRGAVTENATGTSPFRVVYNFTNGRAVTATVSWNLTGTGYQMLPYPNSAILVEGAPLADGSIPYAIYTPSAGENLMSLGSFTAQANPNANKNITHISFFGLPGSGSPPTPTPTPSQGGTFVIGDNNAVVGQHVMFWGTKWAKHNSLSSGRAPRAFKGFANTPSTNPPVCGGTWLSGPRRAEQPPATISSPITVIVASSIGWSGSMISGNIAKIATVMPDPGYSPKLRRHGKGTGTVLSITCTTP
jgi:hypothetical protein